MALLVLIFTGALLGWIATIIVRVEDRGGILTHVAVGVIGAVVAGVLTNSGSILGGLSAVSFLAALLGASLVLAAYVILRRRLASQ